MEENKIMEEDNIELLIKIILYLLLAIAFFSNYGVQKDDINFMMMVIFLFGIISLFFLYIGKSLDKDYLKNLGYVFAGSFTLAYGWFIFNAITLKYPGTIITNSLILLFTKTIQCAFFIPLLVIFIIVIIRWFDDYLTSKITAFKPT